MIVEKLISVISRLFFVGAFVLFGIGVFERIAYAAGYTIPLVGPFTGGRLLEIAAVLLVFVIAMQLREMKEELTRKKP
jgi:hypothetical protein